MYFCVCTEPGLIELLAAKDNGDGTYTVNYSPSAEGSHSFMVKYGDNTTYSRFEKTSLYNSLC